MPARATGILELNCAALARRDPVLAAEILSCSPDGRIGFLTARSGALVPAVRGTDGLAPLHSLYDPAREAEKMRGSWGAAGCIVMMGLGAGVSLQAMLEERTVCAVIVVEAGAPVLRSLFARLPFQAILEDPRVSILTSVEEVRRRLPEIWQPALMGSLRTVPLRPWCEREKRFFKSATAAVQSAVGAVGADYSVQAHFGKRWFSNMILNMERAERSPFPSFPGSSARVTAAGPSLDLSMDRISSSAAEGALLATDTSLPALTRAGITPAAVLSIDCQIYGYHHFMQGLPEGTVMHLDLASPPSLARRLGNPRFLASAHPFALYLCRHWRPFPRVETGGGNVTHAAVALAVGFGAKRVFLYGADFSYPGGKPYARGTYIYDVFDGAQDRYSPTEGRMYSFVFRTPGTRGERSGDHVRYTTDLLLRYRERLLDYMRTSEADIVPVPGEGLSLAHLKAGSLKTAVPPTTLEWSRPPACGWRDTLDCYAAALAALPGLDDPPWRLFSTMSAGQQETWSTLIPVAARCAQETGQNRGAARALDDARLWTLARVQRLESSTTLQQ